MDLPSVARKFALEFRSVWKERSNDGLHLLSVLLGVLTQGSGFSPSNFLLSGAGLVEQPELVVRAHSFAEDYDSAKAGGWRQSGLVKHRGSCSLLLASAVAKAAGSLVQKCFLVGGPPIENSQ